ncbi:putative fimbrial chaperone protein [Yersinia rohdei]|uniref:fimbrial biogenesis chaperone n=1 Tax=Yersinia rohdei TaxID=29485 RepID=UPI0005DB3FF4|nr:molecular chaperone [Yersinia rohdei]CNI32035.1 putative fimbrial chaperone protein [Yersinia rohdei]
MPSKYRNSFLSFLSFLLVLITFDSYAGIIIGGTRVIYQGDKKESSISIRNPDNTPYLIQSWLNTNSNQQNNDIPFVITPPLFRLNADATNALRIVKTKDLPDNRESVYWLNIKAIPTSSPNAKNELNISVNSRIKLFYRPASLNSQDAAVAYKEVSFNLSGNKLSAHNPTPFYISLNELNVNGTKIPNPGMIAPLSEQQWDMPAKVNSNELKVSWSAINDFGGESALATQAR